MRETHSSLSQESEIDDRPTLDLVLFSVRDNRGPKVRLSGYGVELQIKSTEYKAQDDTKVT